MMNTTASHALAALLKAQSQKTTPDIVLRNDTARDHMNKPRLERWTKAAVDALDTGNTSAAVRELYADFETLLRDQAILPNLPAAIRIDLDTLQGGSVNIPVGGGRGAMKAAWIEEGGAIPVAGGEILNREIGHKQRKLISVFSDELLSRSIPEIADVIQQQLIDDTSEAMDADLFDNTARTNARPAGLSNATEIGAGNSVSITSIGDPSDTAEVIAKISADLRGMLSRAKAARAHRAGVWVADPDLIEYLSDLRDTNGNLAFPSLTTSGTLKGHRIIASANAPASKLIYISDRALAIAAGTPTLRFSSEAVIHMSDAPDANIGSASPLQSMFQTSSTALKLTLATDWRCIREGGIQSLNGVNAWLA